MLKTIPLLLETMKCHLTNLKGDCLVLEAGKTKKMTKIFKNPKKCEFCQKKIAKICDIQKLKPIPWQLNISQ